MKKSVWSTILKVIIAVATAIAGAFGLQAANCFSKPPHPFPLPKEDNLPKRDTLYPEGQSFSRGRPLLKEPGTALHPALAGGRKTRRPK